MTDYLDYLERQLKRFNLRTKTSVSRLNPRIVTDKDEPFVEFTMKPVAEYSISVFDEFVDRVRGFINLRHPTVSYYNANKSSGEMLDRIQVSVMLTDNTVTTFSIDRTVLFEWFIYVYDSELRKLEDEKLDRILIAIKNIINSLGPKDPYELESTRNE